jgi:CHAT domain-containing protein/tetratricopeptide (TPR) repeat protein
MNWDAIADRLAVEPSQFLDLLLPAQNQLVRSGLDWVLERYEKEPDRCLRVSRAVANLIDAAGLRDQGLRTEAALYQGVCALKIGDTDEAVRFFRHVIAQPLSDLTRQHRLAAESNLAVAIFDREPEQAERLLRKARAEACRDGMFETAANASISLGSLLRRRGKHEGAARVYEQGLAYSSSSKPPEVVGRLHGNLANVLTDDLGRHREALPHYTKAIEYFVQAGMPVQAAARGLHLVETALRLGEFDFATDSLEVSLRDGILAPDGLANLLETTAFSDLPGDALLRWDSILRALPSHVTPPLPARTSGAIVGARVVLCCLTGDVDSALQLADDEWIDHLHSSPLHVTAIEMLGKVAVASGRPGILWRLGRSLGETPFELRSAFIREQACKQLGRVSIEVSERVKTFEFAVAELRERRLDGMAGVPAIPPEWLSLSEERERIFRALRGALCPSEAIVAADLSAVFHRSSVLSSESRFDEAADALRSAVELADLLGHAQLQIPVRVNLVNAMRRATGGLPLERYEQCLELLTAAFRLAEGLPREQVRVLVTRGTIRKESAFAADLSSLEASIEDLRLAMEIATENSVAQELPSVLVSLANSLSESGSESQMSEAEALLREALRLAADAEPDEQNDLLGTVHNSLGTVLLKLAQRKRDPSLLASATSEFEEARKIREGQTDPDPLLVTLGNVLAAKLVWAQWFSEPLGADLLDVVKALRARSADARNPVVTAGILYNAARALDDAGSEEAIPVGLAAIRSLELLGESQRLVDTCTMLGSLASERKQFDIARSVFERGVAALEKLPSDGSRREFQPQEGLESIYFKLADALEATASSTLDVWWAVERGASRAASERTASDAIVQTRSETVKQLNQNLPIDTLLLYVFPASARHIRGMAVGIRDGNLIVDATSPRLDLEHFTLATGGWVESDTRYTRDLDPRSPATLRRTLSLLHENLLGPLLNGAAPEHERIVLISYALPTSFPWQELPIAPNLSLGDRFQVAESPNAAVLLQRLTRCPQPMSKAVLIACDPSGTLSSHITEVQDVLRMLDVPERIVLTDASGPVTRARVAAEIATADLIHFAGHGLFERGKPDRQGLLLDDGLLNLRDLKAMFERRAPSVVFLSACDLGRSHEKSDTAHNFAASLLSTGVGVVIGSVWAIPDSVARETAREFYHYLPQEGSAVRALHLANRSLARSPNAEVRLYSRSFRAVGWG